MYALTLKLQRIQRQYCKGSLAARFCVKPETVSSRNFHYSNFSYPRLGVSLWRGLAGTRSAPKKERRIRITFFFASSFVGLSLCTPTCCQAQRANSTEGERCLAFIMTSRPGGAASVPYGDVFQTLKEAQQDALNRCSLTNLVQEGWGPCRTWCVKAD
jgi:hypothetical protein